LDLGGFCRLGRNGGSRRRRRATGDVWGVFSHKD
jgi:hypothetical protein